MEDALFQRSCVNGLRTVRAETQDVELAVQGREEAWGMSCIQHCPGLEAGWPSFLCYYLRRPELSLEKNMDGVSGGHLYNLRHGSLRLLRERQ